MKFYPDAICIDFRGLLFLGVKKHIAALSCSGSFRNDRLAQEREL